jgi:DNA-binding NtrC family response regulator
MDMQPTRVLAVDDEERFLTSLAKLLAKKGYQVETATGGAQALSILTDHDVDVMILDVKMPGMDGMTTFKEAKKIRPLMEVIMLTGHATVDTALEAIKIGAFEYLMKPCAIDELIEKVKQAADRKGILLGQAKG